MSQPDDWRNDSTSDDPRSEIDSGGDMNPSSELFDIIDRAILPPPLTLKREALSSANKGAPGRVSMAVNSEETFAFADEKIVPGKVAQGSLDGVLLKEYISYFGVSGHLIRSYDHWIAVELANLIRNSTIPVGDHHFRFTHISRLPPHYQAGATPYPLTPALARREGLTYSLGIYVNVALVGPGGEVVQEFTEPISIASIPLMLGSKYCVLHGATKEQLAAAGEDPDDPLGYFVVKGREFLVVLQEQLRLSKFYLIPMKTGGKVACRMTVPLLDSTSLIQLALNEKGAVQIQLPALRRGDTGNKGTNSKSTKGKYQDINVLHVFHAYGLDDAQAEGYIRAFLPEDKAGVCLQKLVQTRVECMGQPLDAFVEALNMKMTFTPAEQHQAMWRVLDGELFPHLNPLPAREGESEAQRVLRIARLKLCMLGMQIARILEYLAGFRKMDDRDSWSNKRLESASRMMEQLFRTSWKRFLTTVAKSIPESVVRGIRAGKSIGQNTVTSWLMTTSTTSITDNFIDSFATSNWGIKNVWSKTNVAQALKRDNFISVLSQLGLIDVSVLRNDRKINIRLVQGTQWGFVDAVKTTDSDACGIVKYLALTTQLTIEDTEGEAVVHRYLQGFGPNPPLVFDHPDPQNRTRLMLNGKFLGWCPGQTVRALCVNKRRSLEFPRHLSVVHEHGHGDDTIYIHTDASRLVRPLLVVEESGHLVIDRLSRESIAAGGKSLYGMPFEELVARGAVEYLDPWEQEYARVASTRNDVYSRLLDLQELEANYETVREEMSRATNASGEGFDPERASQLRQEMEEAGQALLAARKARRYTHCEVDPLAILSVAASINPYPNHSQAPRNMYQSNMATQAVGLIHRNLGDRFESDKVRSLAYPNEPLVRTLLDENYGLRSHPQGNMVTAAFSCYTGATQEDAFLVKKSSLERGLFRYVKTMVVTAKIQRETQRLGRPNIVPGSPRAAAYRFMEANGLPMIGAYLKTDDAVVGILQNSLGGGLDDVSLTLKLGEDGIVDDVLVTGDETSTTVKVRLRIMRVPEAGDKLASRYAQKGTIGRIIPDEDMPFDPETGMRPDIVVNPHAIPSRMTCGLVLELVAGKYASLRGDRIDASAFRHYDFDDFKRLLKAYNFNEEGYHLLTSPITGQPQRFQTFMGPCYFQLLKHIAKDKIQRRGRGSLRPDTRQPPQGRNLGGGLRFGEMERDAAMAFGAAAFTQERLCKLSDAYKVVMCRVCGEFAQSDPAGERFICRTCGSKDQFGVTEMPYAFKYVKQLIATLGINLGFKLALPNEKSRQLMQGEDFHTEGRDYDDVLPEEEEEEEDYDFDDVAEVTFEE